MTGLRRRDDGNVAYMGGKLGWCQGVNIACVISIIIAIAMFRLGVFSKTSKYEYRRTMHHMAKSNWRD